MAIKLVLIMLVSVEILVLVAAVPTVTETDGLKTVQSASGTKVQKKTVEVSTKSNSSAILDMKAHELLSPAALDKLTTHQATHKVSIKTTVGEEEAAQESIAGIINALDSLCELRRKEIKRIGNGGGN